MGFSPGGNNLININDIAFDTLKGYDALVYDNTIAKWKNASVTSRTHAPAVGQGELSFNILDYGADGTSANDSQAFLKAINAANTLDVDGNATTAHPVYVPAGNWRPKIDIVDKNLRLYGPGVLIQESGSSAIRVEATMGSPLPISTGRVTYTNTVKTELKNSDGSSKLDAQGNKTYSISSTVSMYTSFKFSNPSDIFGIKNADIYHLASKDRWADSYVANQNNTGFKAAIIPILGIAVDFIPTDPNNIGITEYTTVTNGANTASAYIQSVVSKTDGAMTMVLYNVTGSSAFFSNRDTIFFGITNVGTVSGDPYLISPTKLIDTYSTQVVLRKVNTTNVIDLDVTLSTFADPYRSIPSSERKPSVDIYGYCYPKIKIHVKQAYTRTLALNGVYMADVDSFVEQAANNPTPGQNAVGYGPEVVGATTACSIRTRGGGMRHGFTTNTTSFGSYPTTNSSLLMTGAPNGNIVTGVIANSLGAGFDTHYGAYNTIFINCVSIYNGSGAVTSTSSTGFNNRGFGTQFINCISIGAMTAFKDSGSTVAAPYDNTIVYKDCQALDYAEYGFNLGGNSRPSETNGSTRYELDNVSSSGDGSSLGAPFTQVGVLVGNGRRISINGGKHRKFNYAGISVQGGALSVDITGSPYLDYTECKNTAVGLYVDGSPVGGSVIIESLNIKSATIAGTLIPATLIAVPTPTTSEPITASNIRIGNVTDITGAVTDLLPETGVGNITYISETGNAYSTTNTWDPLTIASGGSITTTFTIPNKIPRTAFVIGWTCSASIPPGAVVTGYVSGVGVLRIELFNGSGGDWTPGNATWRSKIIL